MQVKSITPIISTPKLEEVKAFYTQHLGFSVAYDGSWYLSLQSPDDKSVAIDFMRPNPKYVTEAIFKTTFSGQGAFIALEVEDVDREYERLQAAGVTAEAQPKDEPWGQRRFAIIDPCGLAIDIFKWIPPTGEFAEEFAASAVA